MPNSGNKLLNDTRGQVGTGGKHERVAYYIIIAVVVGFILTQALL